MPEVTPELIFQVANGFMAAKHLFVANEVGLFVALAASPGTLDDMAQRTGIPRRTLRILADAMVALGFLVSWRVPPACLWPRKQHKECLRGRTTAGADCRQRPLCSSFQVWLTRER
jgi:Dimerisation domain